MSLLASLKAINGNRLINARVHPHAREVHELENERRGVSAHVHHVLEDIYVCFLVDELSEFGCDALFDQLSWQAFESYSSFNFGSGHGDLVAHVESLAD